MFRIGAFGKKSVSLRQRNLHVRLKWIELSGLRPRLFHFEYITASPLNDRSGNLCAINDEALRGNASSFWTKRVKPFVVFKKGYFQARARNIHF